MKKDKAKDEIFVEYNYKELKDLGKHFLTISSASIVLVLAFYEKFSTSAQVGERVFNSELKIGGTLLIVSIICCGIGLFTNYIAGAGASNSMMWKIGQNYQLFTKFTYILYIIAGVSLIIAYLVLLFMVSLN